MVTAGGEMVTALLFLAAIGCLTSLTAAQQAGCSNIPTSAQVAILIAQNYAGFGQGSPATITLQSSPFGYRVVCSSSSGVRNQYRFVSIVAYYTTSDASLSPQGIPIYGQFEFECVNSAWSATSTLLDILLYDRTMLSAGSAAITANITTNCAYCLKPSVSPERVSDSTNHCSACVGCSQPLCYTPDTVIPNSGTISQTCCNYYLPDGVTCTTACGPLSFPDVNGTCTLCTLNCQNGGTLRSDMCGCNCTAVSTGSDCSTCLCQNGGTCNGTTCTCPPGYSGQLCDTCTLTCPAGYHLNSSNCSCAAELCRGDINVSSIQGTYSWPEAEPGQSVSQRCQYGGADQNITRFCNGNLTWIEDASKCPTVLSVQVNQLNMLVENTSITVENVDHIATELLAVVSQIMLVADQSPSNLAVVTNIMKQISNLSSQNEEAVTNVVGILNSIQQWPPSVLAGNGSSIIKAFETIAITLVQQTNFTSLMNNTIGNQVIFSAEKVSQQPLRSSGKRFNITKANNTLIIGNNSGSPTTLRAAVFLPPSLFSSINGTNVGIFFSAYTTSSFFPLANTSNTTSIASLVLGATVVAEGYGGKQSTAAFTNLTDPIQFAFTIPSQANSSYICVSWNFNAAGGRGNWTSDGCITNTSRSITGQILCQCTHLTNFAILVDISNRISDGGMSNKAILRALEIISYIGVSLSIVGLVVTVISLTVIVKLRQKDISKYHIQLCCALIGMLLVFVTGIDRTETFGGCVTVSVLIHYFTLVAVMWMGAEALLMFQKLVIVFVHITTRYIIILSLVSWLVPLVPVVVSLTINRNFLVKRNSAMEYCFISDTRVFFAAFLGPILLVLFFNALIFVAVAIVLVRHWLQKSKTNAHTFSVQMLNLLGVFILFGLTWTFGTLTVIKAHQAFEIVFTVINSLQGFLIFIFFCALNKDVREALSEILKRHHVLHHGSRVTGLKPLTMSSQLQVHHTKSETLELDDEEIKAFDPSALYSRTYSVNKSHMTELVIIKLESEVVKNQRTSTETFDGK